VSGPARSTGGSLRGLLGLLCASPLRPFDKAIAAELCAWGVRTVATRTCFLLAVFASHEVSEVAGQLARRSTLDKPPSDAGLGPGFMRVRRLCRTQREVKPM